MSIKPKFSGLHRKFAVTKIDILGNKEQTGYVHDSTWSTLQGGPNSKHDHTGQHLRNTAEVVVYLQTMKRH